MAGKPCSAVSDSSPSGDQLLTAPIKQPIAASTRDTELMAAQKLTSRPWPSCDPRHSAQSTGSRGRTGGPALSKPLWLQGFGRWAGWWGREKGGHEDGMGISRLHRLSTHVTARVPTCSSYVAPAASWTSRCLFWASRSGGSSARPSSYANTRLHACFAHGANGGHDTIPYRAYRGKGGPPHASHTSPELWVPRPARYASTR